MDSIAKNIYTLTKLEIHSISPVAIATFTLFTFTSFI